MKSDKTIARAARKTSARNISLRDLIPRWLAAIIGAAGSVLGFATNLYSDVFRSAISESGKHITVVLSPLITCIVASTSTLLIYRWLLSRRKDRTEVLENQIYIDTDALMSVDDEKDAVAGRSLQFLEAKRPSEDLLIFLHGLGLDANDFRPYMAESRFHCIALTLYGFNVENKDDHYYRSISLESHVHLISYALASIQATYPKKRVTLVGFSFGADMIFLLAQLADQAMRDLGIRMAVLLDPNINDSTTTISSRISEVDTEHPMPGLSRILESAATISEFRNLCEYLYKITTKDLAHVKRHANEVLELYRGDSYEPFLDNMGRLSELTEEIYVALSSDYEEHFNRIVHRTANRGMSTKGLTCSRSGHFELIGTNFLKATLEGIVAMADLHFR